MTYSCPAYKVRLYLKISERVFNMKYEIVELKEKTVAGLSAVTSNLSPDMAEIIGGLWEKFYAGGVYEALAKGEKKASYGIYTQYESDETGSYTFMTACESGGENLPENITKMTIPAGKYAKFTAVGDVRTAVMNLWKEIWEADLQRAFICDFEEYTSDEMKNAVISIYVGLK